MFDHVKECYANQQPLNGQSWSYVEDSNYFSMRSYIDSLFERNSRLLVIRIDFGFRSNTRGQHDAEYAREYLQRLMNNRRRNSIFESEVGYLWSMEFGVDKGFHYHCIFFFDGHLRQQGAFIGHAIGRYWNEAITEGTGCFYCSNANMATLEQQGYPIGIGMINRGDAAKRDNLVSCATYLLKEGDEQLLRRALPEGLKGFRTFGRGVI